MQTLTGTHIKLRALEPTDLPFLFHTENNEVFWEVSHTQVPFSKYLLKQYLKNTHLSIYQTQQLRLVIEEIHSKQIVGMIDLFDFNAQHNRAGVGILISEAFQRKGFASKALSLLIQYAFTHLNLHQLYANITSDNTKSLQLFKKHHFTLIGTKKDWILTNGIYKDELLFQLIND